MSERKSKRAAAPRQSIEAALPDLLGRALDGYKAFAERPAPEEPKDFAHFQAGCKAALGHLEALLRLERSLANRPGEGSQAPDRGAATEAEAAGADPRTLVRQARSGVHRLRGDA